MIGDWDPHLNLDAFLMSKDISDEYNETTIDGFRFKDN